MIVLSTILFNNILLFTSAILHKRIDNTTMFIITLRDLQKLNLNFHNVTVNTIVLSGLAYKLCKSWITFADQKYNRNYSFVLFYTFTCISDPVNKAKLSIPYWMQSCSARDCNWDYISLKRCKRHASLWLCISNRISLQFSQRKVKSY